METEILLSTTQIDSSIHSHLHRFSFKAFLTAGNWMLGWKPA